MRAQRIWIILGLIFLNATGLGREIFIAPQGKDGAEGSREKPLATLEGARDLLRKWCRRGNQDATTATIWIRGGFYARQEPFELVAEDSGTTGAAVVYRGWGEGAVRLSGGILLDGDWFTTVTRGTVAWARIDPLARGRVLQADLRAHGVVDFGKLEPRGYVKPGKSALELFYKGDPLTLARWPNEGFVRIAGAPDGPGGKRFVAGGERIKRWAAAPDPWVTGYFRYGWADSTVAIGGIDAARGIITVATEPAHGIAAGTPYFVFNLLEELDCPGEWYLDRAAGMLYLWPPGAIGKDNLIASMMNDELIRVRGARHVTLQGLTLEACRGAALSIEEGIGVRVRECAIRNTGTRGVRIAGGRNVVVERCEISGNGTGGVWMEGGDRATLRPAGHVVRDSRIHHFGRWCRTSTPGIEMGGVGCAAEHNEISDAPQIAILYRGNEHRIEGNRIHDVCLTADDGGAIYTGRDWGARGNVIRHNLIHDVRSELAGTGGVHGIYLDDCASGNVVRGNIVMRVGGFGVLIGGGRDNAIENNIFTGCAKAAIHLDARGEKLINDVAGDSFNLKAKIEAWDYARPPWSEKYPQLAGIMREGAAEAKKPKGNRIRRNIGWRNGAWLHENLPGTLKYLEEEGNLSNADPRFMDEAGMDLRLRGDSPARGIVGFEEIPAGEIGVVAPRSNHNPW